jgi:transposase
MSQHSSVAGIRTIGLDLGDRFSQVCGLLEDGSIAIEGKVASRKEALRLYFGRFKGLRIVCEVGTHSPWVKPLLESLGHEVLVANPRKLRALYASGHKSDVIDARMLARVGRMDPALLGAIHHRSLETQADLAVLRARAVLVRARTKLVNHVRGAVKSMGARLPKCSTPRVHQLPLAEIPERLRPALSPLLLALAAITAQIQECERRIAALCTDRYIETALPMQVRGVGPVTALCFLLTLETPDRFKKSRMVGAYLGLTPRQHSSGERDPELPITKAGDRMLRTLLIQCAHYILGPFGPDSDLRRFGQALLERGGRTAKKKAVTAVARKLAVLLHRLWYTGEEYDPLRASRRRERAMKMKACA